MTTLLDTLSLPEDLKTLTKEQHEQLASEVRQRLLEVGDTCGGHLASNLGVVELTIALHTVFSSPTDKFLWDTSHQTYVHKMFTGRLDRIHTIRQDGGLSGFAKITESEHDTFGAGHASTSLSAALGVAQSRDLRGEDYSVVAIAGDSAFSGGMMFEALNNIEKLKDNSNFICILNDNNMSISPPVGNMSTYITNIRTSKLYNDSKHRIEDLLNRIPKVGKPLTKVIDKALLRMKDVVIDVKMGVIFEEFGFKYIGPIDGHDITQMMAALRYAKTYKGPVMIHAITMKGKGHTPAEDDPVKYHGVSPKKKESPKIEVAPVEVQAMPSYTKVFGKKVIDIAQRHDDVVVITPAMQGGSGLDEYAATFPKRFIDVGIAEEHAVTFAAGMAKGGMKPILAIYSTFLQRGYDQLVHDVCLQKLPVIFALDRAGLVGQDGPTHHGVLDYNYELPIPNLRILAPKDGDELERMLDWSVGHDLPVSIRYSKLAIPSQNGQIATPMALGKAEVLFESPQHDLDVLLVGVGSMAWPCHEAALTLDRNGTHCAAINLRFVKPLDVELLTPYIQRAKKIVVAEEGQSIGGVMSYMMQHIPCDKLTSDWHSIAIPDEFADHGKPTTLLEHYGFTADQIANTVRTLVLERTPSN